MSEYYRYPLVENGVTDLILPQNATFCELINFQDEQCLLFKMDRSVEVPNFNMSVQMCPYGHFPIDHHKLRYLGATKDYEGTLTGSYVFQIEPHLKEEFFPIHASTYNKEFPMLDRIIKKFRLQSRLTILPLPKSFKVLKLALEKDIPWIWVEMECGKYETEHDIKIQIFKTDERIPELLLDYFGSIIPEDKTKQELHVYRVPLKI